MDDGSVDDEAYVQALLAILTNPNPTGIDPDDPYGQADDGIDRYDGFGREVWVESLRITDGEYGPELEVGFGLAVPPGAAWRPVPRSGLVRLPFESGWRHLSGYDDPAAYAPEVAREVWLAANQHTVRYRSGSDWLVARDRVRAALPDRDVQWQMLLDALNAEGTVVEGLPTRIDVQLDDGDDGDAGPSDFVTVVVTPDQWEDVLVDHASHDVNLYMSELIGPRDDDERFLVFYEGDLVRSSREELPPVRGRAFELEIAELRARYPDAEFEWRAYPPDGE